ncbi:MAG: hypothetical protein J1E61_00580 [Lachnospiraceae bacterium]|nr:hypothetical protein [Lachnospiraceae bacterium]
MNYLFGSEEGVKKPPWAVKRGQEDDRISDQTSQIMVERKAEIKAQMEEKIAEKDKQLADRDKQLTSRDAQIQHLEELLSHLTSST